MLTSTIYIKHQTDMSKCYNLVGLLKAIQSESYSVSSTHIFGWAIQNIDEAPHELFLLIKVVKEFSFQVEFTKVVSLSFFDLCIDQVELWL